MGIAPKNITEAHLKACSIGQDYWEVDFSNYRGPNKAKEAGIMYLKNLAVMKDKGLGLLLAGPPGPGKTTLAMIVMKYLARANWTVHCTSLGEIVEQIQKSWNSSSQGDSDEGRFLANCREADFLLIDDVGKEHRGQTGFVQTVFDNLIRYRVQHRLPTFVTTNLTKSELEGTYGESAMSLLEGKLLPVTVDGEDHRRTVQKQDIRETFKG